MIEFKLISDPPSSSGILIKRDTPFRTRWRLRNTGSEPWLYSRLVYCGGTISPIDLTHPLPPLNSGEETTVLLDMIAPNELGNHRGCWEFHAGTGLVIGEQLSITIEVTAGGRPNGRLISFETDEQPGFGQVEAGHPFTQTIVIENSGPAAWELADRLIFMGGDAVPQEKAVPLQALNPGEQQLLTLNFIAGSTVGRAQTFWRLRGQNSGYFGAVITPSFEIGPAVTVPPPAMRADPQQWRKVIWDITGIFESGRVGGDPAALQTHDEGIISYGKHQATLQSGNLAAILELFINRSRSQVAIALQTNYLNRVQQRDPALRHDDTFHTLLRQAATDPKMIAAQDDLFARHFYDPTVARAAELGVQTPLGHACLYDTRIQHGSGGADFIIKLTSKKWPPPAADSSVAEDAWLAKFLDEREALLIRLADKRDAEADQTSDAQRQQSLRLTARALRISTFRAQELRTLLQNGNLQLKGPFEVRGLEIDGL